MIKFFPSVASVEVIGYQEYDNGNGGTNHEYRYRVNLSSPFKYGGDYVLVTGVSPYQSISSKSDGWFTEVLNAGGEITALEMWLNTSVSLTPVEHIYYIEQSGTGYGMMINKSNGQGLYDSTINSWSQLGLVLVDIDKSFNFDSSIFSEVAVTFWFVDIPPTTAKLLAPGYSISSGSISFVRQGFNAYALILGR